MTDLVCPKCSSDESSDCDNDCGTIYCAACGAEYYLRCDVITLGHAPEGGIFSDDSEDVV